MTTSSGDQRKLEKLAVHGDKTVTVDFGGAHVYRADVREVDGEPRIVELTISIAVDDRGRIRGGRTVRNVVIDREVLRAVPVLRIAKTVILLSGEHESFFQRLKLAAAVGDAPRRGKTLDDLHYREVAEVARAAKREGLSAREAIKARWQVAYPTADGYIRAAKERGYLTDLRRPARGTQ